MTDSSANTPLLNATSSDKTRLWPALAEMMRQFALRDDNCLPAMVQAYDRVKNVVTVKPLISWVTIDNKSISRSPLAKIPAMSFGGGGFHLNFPLKAGDLGWIIATDRDLSLYLQNLKESPPNSGRYHSFSDSVFIPDVMRQYTVNAEDSTAMVLQSTDGSTRIAIDVGGVIRITAPTSVTVTSPQTTFTGNVEIKQSLTVDQNSHVKGSETVDGTLTNNGINVTTHGHVSSAVGTRTGNMEA
jgi:phage baseplate assembly protein gpV